ncbi:MAG: Eco57I restriction-modification methylase domain-containing protein [Chloroflexi bacterium]|nr:Eco57I restriction-modification methylase domain-containing protein [Chloroflexota bacterium]
MSKKLLQKVIDKGVEGYLNEFFQNATNCYAEAEDDLSEYDDDEFSGFHAIGEINFSPAERLVVVTASIAGGLTERSGKKAQYEKARKILKQYMRYDAGMFVFSDQSGNFRLSLVYGTPDAARTVWSNFRRFTYFVSSGQTNNTFKKRIGECSFASLDIVKDAFSVEKVNKLFYEEIARYFYRLTGRGGFPKELTLSSVDDGDKKAYEEFAVRLIGRAIFCWFLKHKKSAAGIPLISDSALSTAAASTHLGYYHAVLEPLFFGLMNTPVKERKPVAVPEADKVPFLNGGLFEPHENDFYKRSLIDALKIPDTWFKDFFSVLEQYNFTIDENSTVDAEVSVDPEMLGRIFENLLAEVVPETGETARKATGSYYTPRVIVDYMVEQSLKQYLLTKTAISEDNLAALLSYEDEGVELTDEQKNSVVTALKEIKIIDPACGSGAFPMGILHRMLLALERVDPKLEIWRKQYLSTLDSIVRQTVEKNVKRENWAYIRKLMIIRDSIYGVDIQPIAVEIAKLRCFLSLVVDEMVLDNEGNRGIEPLPNLEFKFVAANTLIGLPEITGMGLMENKELISKLATLRKSYFADSENKEAIKHEFKAVQAQLSEHARKMLVAVKTDLTGAAKKIESKDTTQTRMLAEWDPFSYKRCDWFDTGWMFGVSDGFDVVIANPPYIQLQSVQQEADRLEKMQYQSFARMGDIYCLFYERGYGLLADSGVLSFITSNKWIRAGYGKAIREFFAHKTNPLRLIDFAGQRIFDSATVDVSIMIFEKGKNKGQTEACVIKDDCLNNLSVYIERNSAASRFNSNDSWAILSPIEQSIKGKIDTAGVPLKEWDVHINYGIKTGFNEAFIIDRKKRDELIAADPKSAEIIRPILRGRDIKRYHYEFANLWLIATFPSLKYDIEQYPSVKEYLLSFGIERLRQTGEKHIVGGQIVTARKKTNNKWFETQDSISYWDDFSKQKIVWGNLCLRAQYALVGELYFISAPATMIVPGDRYLLSVLNSKVADFYVRGLGVTRNGGYFEYKPMFIEKLPVPILSEAEKTPFISCVSLILEAKSQNNPTTVEEQRLDDMICDLYGFNEEERTFLMGK